MKMYKMPVNKPVCLLYAAAMVLDVEPEKLAEEIGHDGLKVRWPEKWPPHCYQGIHIEELANPCLTRGYALMNISFFPMISSCPNVEPYPIYPPHIASGRFEQMLSTRLAIVFVHVKGNRHAVAWDGLVVYDPKGTIGTLHDYLIEDAYLLLPIKQ